MIHQPFTAATAKTIKSIGSRRILWTSQARQLRIFMHKGKPVSVIKKDLERYSYMSATEAQAYGIFDRIDWLSEKRKMKENPDFSFLNLVKTKPNHFLLVKYKHNMPTKQQLKREIRKKNQFINLPLLKEVLRVEEHVLGYMCDSFRSWVRRDERIFPVSTTCTDE